ncbi:MAG TPA: peroxiredoxin [Verrucomicrobia bacterium]|nr:MAG: peroxiredoxin [Lentisphaerae bacterium GWF2_57_35]HBA83277.1 peroxiredoxin [Verrucomicrobiota bacterium]
MPARKANAVWTGNLKQGRGTMRLGSGAFEGPYSFTSRFENGNGTNPEELIAAAHAGCFSMALAHLLSQKGHEPKEVKATSDVHLEAKGADFAITTIDLEVKATVPGLSDDEFRKYAEEAKNNCLVSKVLSGAEIRLRKAELSK